MTPATKPMTDELEGVVCSLLRNLRHRGGGWAGQAFTAWACATCGKTDTHANTGHPTVCAECWKLDDADLVTRFISQAWTGNRAIVSLAEEYEVTKSLAHEVREVRKERDELRSELDRLRAAVFGLQEMVNAVEDERNERGAEIMKLRSELDRLTKREGEWREAMRRCEHRGCTEPATLVRFAGEEVYCDEHAEPDCGDLDYAHLIRSREGT